MDGMLPLPLPLPSSSSTVKRTKMLAPPQIPCSELVRGLAETLGGLGYERAARMLEEEAGVSRERDSVGRLRILVQQGAFQEALAVTEHVHFASPKGAQRARAWLVQHVYLDHLAKEVPMLALRCLHTQLKEVMGGLPHGGEDLQDLAALLACPTLDTLDMEADKLLRRQWARCTKSELMTPQYISNNHDFPASLADRILALVHHDSHVPRGRVLELFGQALAAQMQSRSSRPWQCDEPLPLLLNLDTWETLRDQTHIPSTSRICLDAHGEPWCTAFSPTGDRFAVGFKDGSVAVYRLTSTTVTAVEQIIRMKPVEEVAARRRGGGGSSGHGEVSPISNLVWGHSGLVCVARSLGFHNTSEETLVHCVTFDNTTSTTTSASSSFYTVVPIPQAHHHGNPCAAWSSRTTTSPSLCTSGPDGWIKLFSFTTNVAATAAAHLDTQFRAPERVIGMCSIDAMADAMILSCADNVIRCVSLSSGGTTLFSLVSPNELFGPVISSGTAIVASMRSVLVAWDTREVQQHSANNNSNGSNGSSPTVMVDVTAPFSGFVSSRFILLPSLSSTGYLATGSEDGIVCIWSMRGGSMTQLKGHTAACNAVCWSPISKLLVSVSDDETIRVWG